MAEFPLSQTSVATPWRAPSGPLPLTSFPHHVRFPKLHYEELDDDEEYEDEEGHEGEQQNAIFLPDHAHILKTGFYTENDRNLDSSRLVCFCYRGICMILSTFSVG